MNGVYVAAELVSTGFIRPLSSIRALERHQHLPEIGIEENSVQCFVFEFSSILDAQMDHRQREKKAYSEENPSGNEDVQVPAAVMVRLGAFVRNRSYLRNQDTVCCPDTSSSSGLE